MDLILVVKGGVDPINLVRFYELKVSFGFLRLVEAISKLQQGCWKVLEAVVMLHSLNVVGTEYLTFDESAKHPLLDLRELIGLNNVVFHLKDNDFVLLGLLRVRLTYQVGVEVQLITVGLVFLRLVGFLVFRLTSPGARRTVRELPHLVE